MLTYTRIKWIAGVALAGILLVLAMIGGKWGTTYDANASINAIPVIYQIFPSRIMAGSGTTTLVISGANFGDKNTTRVRVVGTGVDLLREPIQVLTGGVSATISDTLLVSPTVFEITVVKSSVESIPTMPITPWDEESNAVALIVFEANRSYLPLIKR